MINLLDPEQQRQLKAARLNVRLLRFVTLSLIVVVGVGLVYGAGFWLAFDNRAAAETDYQAAEKELQQYAAVATEAANYRQNLATAKQILGSEMVFSSFLTDFGALMPPNTIVDSLSLSTETVAKAADTSVSITTRAKSYTDVLKIKQAFETSSLFSSVRIVNTSVPDKPETVGVMATYPYEATFEVIVNALKGTQQ